MLAATKNICSGNNNEFCLQNISSALAPYRVTQSGTYRAHLRHIDIASIQQQKYMLLLNHPSTASVSPDRKHSIAVPLQSTFNKILVLKNENMTDRWQIFPAKINIESSPNQRKTVTDWKRNDNQSITNLSPNGDEIIFFGE